MSTVMYAFRCKKETFWDTIKLIYQYYQNESLSRKYISSYYQDANSKEEVAKASSKEKQKELLENVEELFGSSCLQIFDEGESYLFRVIENGYMFLNNYQQQGWDITPCFYDDRAEVGDEENKETAKKIDKKMEQGEYFLYPLVDKVDWKKWLFEAWQQKTRILAKQKQT